MDAMLSNEQKQAMLEERLAGFAAESYQQSLNRKIAVASSITADIEQADAAIVLINEAIEIHETELAAVIAAQ